MLLKNGMQEGNRKGDVPLKKSQRLPEWLKKRLPASANVMKTKKLLEDLGLNTVCQSALCPNQGECFAKKTATFMIMGENCTRNCRFCAVSSETPLPLDEDEPSRVAEAAYRLQLKHVVVTSVTRDDLPDGGASHFANVIKSVRKKLPEAIIEVLTPDFKGNDDSIATVVEARPHIFNHNVETVPRLYERVRPQANYLRSLKVIKKVKELNKDIYTKSGIMVGLGESEKEVIQVMKDLRIHECDILTIGQYLQPSGNHLPVEEYIHPDVFKSYESLAEKLGFKHVASAPLVRSSFNASEFSEKYLTAHT